jgi:hypothetical protein
MRIRTITGLNQGFYPHGFNADPDPAFCPIADHDSGSGSRIRIKVLMT